MPCGPDFEKLRSELYFPGVLGAGAARAHSGGPGSREPRSSRVLVIQNFQDKAVLISTSPLGGVQGPALEPLEGITQA